MRKIGRMMVLICVALTCTISACTSTGYPRFVQDSLKNVPDDVLVGIGVANLAAINLAMTTSTSRALAEISRQMNTIVQEMVRTYQVSNNADSSAAMSFQETIIVTLSQSNLVDSRIVARDQAPDGSVWTVIWLDKANLTTALYQAQETAKQAVPGMDSFDAQDWLDPVFARTAAQEYQVNDG